MDIEECIDSSVSMEQDDQPYIDFQINRARWDCMDISDYQFIHIGTSFSGCVQTESLITVRNDVITSAEILSEGLVSNGCISAYRTVDQYLNKILEAVDKSITIQNAVVQNFLDEPLDVADEIIVSYDQEFGLPLNGYIDYIFGVADEEFRFEIKDFVIIE